MPLRRALQLLLLVVVALVAALPLTGVAPAKDRARAGHPHATPAADSLRAPLTRERFYFLMPDRFANGDPANDRGGLSGPREVTGFDPTRKGWYHGGDLKGALAKLDYIENMGTTAIWLTPSFKNKPVQGLGTPFPSAAYHGYWITDFTQIDPHLGTNQDLRDLIDGAHARGMKVFFDIITNHTADVISYEENEFGYISKAQEPYRDAAGNVFDDRDFAGTDTFPPLDREVSFPYTPFVPAGEPAKSPAWLNDLTLYHNRGNTTFSGENSLYGDFFGLDDLFTEHHEVVEGMEDIYDTWVEDFGVDGFRIDTMKHVNLEFWQQFLPHILGTAHDVDKPHFFAFGEVAEENSTPFLSRFTTAGRSQAVLDFTFQKQARAFARSAATDGLRDRFEQDDWFTDADSNAYQLPTFLGNHDMGHIGMFVRDDNAGADESELLRRDTLAHELMYFSRGNPVVYFGDEQGFTGAGNDQAARQDMFPSLDSEYNNLDDDGIDPLNGRNLSDAGKNDNLGSDVTPAVDNFDPSHPLYRLIQRLSDLRQAHPALADGAQQIRFSSSSPGIFAFSRMDADEQVEYLVALNNSGSPQTASFDTYSRLMPFFRVYGDAESRVKSGKARSVEVTVPALSAVVYRAAHRLKKSDRAPGIALDVADEVSGRPEVRADVTGSSFYEVTFYARAGTGDWQLLGTDDNVPYRVFPDVSGHVAGTRLQMRAVVKDNEGHVAQADATTTVVAPPPGAAGVAKIHYHRPDGNYSGWGLHLWGDAIAEGAATDWTSPRPPSGQDAFGVFFEIPLADPTASLNFILHKGDEKDTPADRSFIPALTPEIWVESGDPTNYPTEP